MYEYATIYSFIFLSMYICNLSKSNVLGFCLFVCLFLPLSRTLLRILRMPWELVWKFLHGRAATCLSLTKEQSFPLSRNVIFFEQAGSYRKDTHRAGRKEGNTFLASQISQITLIINGMTDVAVRSASHLRMALYDAWCYFF